MIIGTSAEPSQSRPVTRRSESHSGVSIGDAVDGSSFDVISTRVGEVADRVHQQRLAPPRRDWPGSVRMSTWSSTRSGMTLVFVPPCTTVGANVVCVHECAMRDEPERELGDVRRRA